MATKINPFKKNNQYHEMTAVLSYLWLLVLIPLLFIEQKYRDDFMKFHLKQGIVLCVVETVLLIAGSILSILPVIGGVFQVIATVIWVILLIVTIIAIIKGLQKEKWNIPILSEYTNLVKLN